MAESRQRTAGAIEIRGDLARRYDDVYTADALAALAALAPLNERRRALMAARIARRAARARDRQRLTFLEPDAVITGTGLTARDAREGRFTGSDIPADLQRQWIQGTGPATRPGQPSDVSLRNVAYALLSGADGWMFDGEDALGQVSTMSLDNQRNLRTAIARDPAFLDVAERVAGEMNAWAQGFFGRPIVADWRRQLDVTTISFRPRGLHLDDRHLRLRGRDGARRLDRRPRALCREQSPAAARSRPHDRALPPENPDRRRGGALGPVADDARAAPGAAGRRHQGVCAGRAARSRLPADGDPGRARRAFRRVQHRPLGLHQQRRRCDGVGSGVHQSQHRRHRHDLRLHADLRGSGPARRQHAGSGRPVRAVAGRHGTQHPRGLGGRCRGRA